MSRWNITVLHNRNIEHLELIWGHKLTPNVFVSKIYLLFQMPDINHTPEAIHLNKLCQSTSKCKHSGLYEPQTDCVVGHKLCLNATRVAPRVNKTNVYLLWTSMNHKRENTAHKQKIKLFSSVCSIFQIRSGIHSTLYVWGSAALVWILKKMHQIHDIYVSFIIFRFNSCNRSFY